MIICAQAMQNQLGPTKEENKKKNKIQIQTKQHSNSHVHTKWNMEKLK